MRARAPITGRARISDFQLRCNMRDGSFPSFSLVRKEMWLRRSRFSFVRRSCLALLPFTPRQTQRMEAIRIEFDGTSAAPVCKPVTEVPATLFLKRGREVLVWELGME